MGEIRVKVGGVSKKMVILEQRSKMFNPYTVNNRTVKEMIFFDKEGIIVKCPQGWFTVEELVRNDGSTCLFESSNNHKGTFEIEGLEAVNKRVFDPKINKAQLIPIKPKYRFEIEEKNASLYIPYDSMEFKITLSVKHLKLTLKTYHYDLVWSDKYKVGFYTDAIIHETPNVEEVAVWRKLKPFLELVEGKELKDYPPYGFDTNFDKIRSIVDRWL